MTEQQYNNQDSFLIGKSRAYNEVMAFASLTKDQSLIDMLNGLIELNNEQKEIIRNLYLESVEIEQK